MRSRYAAFALGLDEYLIRTLASSHPDSALPPDELARDLARVRHGRRFTCLRIVRATTSGESGQVLFLARVFE
jgi:uncharacterized protein YchJ